MHARASKFQSFFRPCHAANRKGVCVCVCLCALCSVARRFVADYGVVRLSIGEAVRSVLDTQPHTELSRHILAFLHDGLTVPDELAVHALEVALMDVKCKTRGYVVVKHGRPSIQWWFHAGGRGGRTGPPDRGQAPKFSRTLGTLWSFFCQRH